jgi:hypothetical protein
MKRYEWSAAAVRYSTQVATFSKARGTACQGTYDIYDILTGGKPNRVKHMQNWICGNKYGTIKQLCAFS